MNIRKTNLSDSHTDGFMRFEEWEHTYQKEQQETNIVIDMIVFIFGFFFMGIVIPVFPAMVIEAFFPEFPSFIVCFLLGLSFFGWLVYQVFHGDCNVAVSVGSNGIRFYSKSGKCTYYRSNQFVNVDLYRITDKGGTISHTYYINIREDDGKNKAIPCNFLSEDDMGRLIKDLDRLKPVQQVQMQDCGSSTPYTAENVISKNVYTYPRENVVRRMRMLKKWLLGALIFCIAVPIICFGFELYIYHGIPPFDLFMAIYSSLICVAFVVFLFFILLPAAYKSVLPEMISGVELMQEGIAITREDRIVIPLEKIRYISLHHPNYCVKSKFGVRKMKIETDERTILCHMGFHPESNKALAMKDYKQFYSDMYHWTAQHGIECFDDVAPR